MFIEVWKWAGEYRKTNKNTGIDKAMISVQLINISDDALYWLKHQSYTDDEFSIRVKH